MVKLLINHKRNYIGDDDSTMLMGLDLLYRALCSIFLFRALQLYYRTFSDLNILFFQTSQSNDVEDLTICSFSFR